jgi:hypothetical protein
MGALKDAIANAESVARMGRWTEIAASGSSEFIFPDSDSADWWIVGSTPSEYRDLAEAVAAFVDVSFAAVEPYTQRPTKLYGVSAADLPVLLGRVRVPPEYVEEIDGRLALLADVWSRRPTSVREAPRTTARLLRDLEDALSSGRLSEAAVLLTALRDTGQMSAANLDFLEIRLAARSARWEEILARQDIEDIARMRLPWRVASTLIEATYHAHVAGWLGDGPGSVVERFRAEIEPRIGPAFRDPSHAVTPGERVAWMAYAVSLDPPSVAIRDAILSQTPKAAEEWAWVEALSQVVDTETQELPAQHSAQELIESGDLPGAWNAVRRAFPRGEVRVRALLHIAYEADSPDWAETAVHEADELLEGEPDALSGRTAQLHLTELSSILGVGGKAIRTWVDWLTALSVSNELEGLVETARDHGPTWPIESLLQYADAPSLVLDLATSDERRASALRQVRPLLLPSLLAAFDDESSLPGTAVSLLAVVSEIIAAEDRVGRYELAALLDVADCVLANAPSEADYGSVVQRGLEPAWLRAGSARELGWLADAVRLVARGPDQFVAPRRSFLELAAAGVAAFLSLYEEDRQGLAEAFGFAGMEVAEFLPAEAASVADEGAFWTPLVGRKTLIYTLVEAAGERARAFLLERVPDAEIEVRSDQVADRRLTEHVRSADVLVIATRAATHAATLEIERQRKPDAIVVYPTGKGWSSMIGSLREVCRGL